MTEGLDTDCGVKRYKTLLHRDHSQLQRGKLLCSDTLGAEEDTLGAEEMRMSLCN